ncbi:type II/IV secretion system ATPase subunit [Methanosarcina sp. MTP4]|uniref:type II/IV secretion system ATPase subunit n=1 Tax=Methanosarcina sp. MTP4 TaxID=1434100 RepID=UPI00064FEDF8|nr:type II/IV secretion system ATPase subunit [Methanosarcina sp. MTP4]
MDTVSCLNPGQLRGQGKEGEELCPYKNRHTKNRKTIVINCKECESESSLNDPDCRRKIFGILRKEVHADCLVLSRLYERDYEGKALESLYTLAGFRESVIGYGGMKMVTGPCTRPEKSECLGERKDFMEILVENAEYDPMKARLALSMFIQAKGLKKVPQDSLECAGCSEQFYQLLCEMLEKSPFLPNMPVKIPALQNHDFSVPAGETGCSAENLLADTSGELAPGDMQHNPTQAPAKTLKSLFQQGENGIKRRQGRGGREGRVERVGESLATNGGTNPDGSTTDVFFDYESRIKPHVRPPFSSSRIYTEAPRNTEFLECYDISSRDERDERVLEISIYRYTDRPEKLYMIRPPEYNLRPEELRLLEKVRKRMIRHRPGDLAFTDPAGARKYFRSMAREFLLEELLDGEKSVSPEELESYSDLLARYTNGLGIVEDLLSDPRVTDVYINAPADLNAVHVVLEGEECVSNVFLSQDDLDALVSRFRTISGRPFGEAVPVLELNLEDFGVRVSVIGDPLSANGLAYAFRKHARAPWTLPKLINTGSISAFSAGFLSFLMDGQASVLIAGEVGAGKTSLLSAMLLEIPQKYRILTIEDTHELPIEKLQGLGWKVQGMSSHSSVLKSGAEISPETALRAALRLGSSSLVIGEVRGPEVKVLYEAMQVGQAGNSVIGTIHGSSAENVYERIVHTLGVPPASFKATDAVIICSTIRPGGSMQKLKRVSQIAEITGSTIENPEPGELFTDIMTYDAARDSLFPGEVLEQGQSELIGKIALKWGISIDQALKNIEIRTRIKEKIAEEGKRRPDLLEAEAVSEANNIFWLLMDSMKSRDKTGFKPGFESETGKGSGTEAGIETGVKAGIETGTKSEIGSKINFTPGFETDFETDFETNFETNFETDFEADFEELYSRWEKWFENFARAYPGA